MHFINISDLEHFYRGKFVEQGKTVGEFTVTACSEGITHDSATRFFNPANFGSYNVVKNFDNLQHGYGLFRYDEDIYVLTHVRPGRVPDRGHLIPDYHCVLIPRQLLVDLAGNLTPLMNLLGDEPHPPTFPRNTPSLERVRLEHLEPLPAWEEEKVLATLYESFRDDAELFGQLLAALLHSQSIAIIDAPIDPQWRLQFVQALWLTLPPTVRYHLTFATEVFESDKCMALVKFLYNDRYARGGERDLHLSWKGRRLNRNPSPHPYAEFLVSNWSGGPSWLVKTMAQWSERLGLITEKTSFVPEVMDILGNRLQLGQQIELGTVQPAALVAVLRSDPTLTLSEEHDFSLSLLDLVVKRGSLELMDVVLERGLVQSLADKLYQVMIRLSEQGFGQNVVELLHRWLLMLDSSSGDSDYWKLVFQKVTIAHVNYLISQGTEGSILTFISDIRNFAESPELQFVLPTLIQELRPASRRYAKVTLEYFSLVVCYDHSSLLSLLKDKEAQRLWPYQLQTVATYISGQSSRRAKPAALVEAVKALKRDREQEIAFVGLAFLAIKQARADLMDASSWEFLQTLSAKDKWYRDKAIQLSKLLGTTDWIKQLRNDDAVLGLVKLRLALSDYKGAVSLLGEIQPQFRGRPDRFAAHVRLTCQTSVTHSEGAFRFLRQMERSQNFAPIIIVGAYVGFLEQFHWRENKLVADLANFLYQHHPKVNLNEQDSLRLLDALAENDKAANQVVDYHLEQVLNQAKSKSNDRLMAEHLNEIAIRVKKSTRLRRRMSQRIRSDAKSLSLEKLKSFHNELRKHQQLSEEAKAINALLTVARVLGHQSLAEFENELHLVLNFLQRLETAFQPHQDGSSEFDWVTFESQLLAQFDELDKKGPSRLAKECWSLAELISLLGDTRTKGSIWSLTNQSSIDHKLRQGTITPESAVDALKRLAGLFGRGRR